MANSYKSRSWACNHPCSVNVGNGHVLTEIQCQNSCHIKSQTITGCRYPGALQCSGIFGLDADTVFGLCKNTCGCVCQLNP
jgi:hypothetical protein